MAAGELKLRDYQHEGVAGIYEQLAIHEGTVGVAATGLGKTVILAELLRTWPRDRGRILVLEPTVELVDQTHRTLSRHLGENVGIEQGTRSDRARGRLWQSRAVVSSVQTISRLGRLRGWDPKEVGLIVCDEGHHAPAKTWRRVMGYFAENKELRKVLLTATPQRGDEVGLRTIAPSVAFNYPLRWGIEEGWLVLPKVRYLRVHGVEFERLKTANGDYGQESIAQAFGGGSGPDDEAQAEANRKLHEVAAPIVELAGNRQGLVFCATKRHAEALAEVMRGNYRAQVAVITEDTSREERNEQLARFRRGELQWLTGVAALAEGFDAPTASVVVVCRPTKSIGLRTQMVGRITRPLEGIVDMWPTAAERRAAIAASAKPFGLVIDCVGMDSIGAAQSGLDVLGEGLPIDIRAEVLAELAASEAEFDPLAVLADIEERQRAAEERRAQAKEQEALAATKAIADRWVQEIRERRMRGLRARVQYDAEEVDLLGAGDGQFRANLMGVARRGSITDRQLGALAHLGVDRDQAISWSKERATLELSQRIKSGGEYVVPFGKFKGRPLRTVPSQWVEWAREKLPAGRARDAILRNYDIMKGANNG